MKSLLDHPWIKVLVIAATVATCSFALRETANITQPIAAALGEVLAPVAVGFAIAYVVMPLVDALGRLGIRRTFAAGLLFGIGSLLLAGTVALVVPAVVRQGIDLSIKVFQGESYVDRNANGRYDPGEPFDDANHDGQRNAAMLSRSLKWLEDGQNRLRVNLGLGLGETALTTIAVAAEDTAGLRRELGDLMKAARSYAPPGDWPVATHPSAGTEWNPTWIGPTLREVEEHAALVPESDRVAWLGRLCAAGAELNRIALVLARAARRIQADANPTQDKPESQDPLILRLRTARMAHLTVEQREAATALALQLETAAKAGQGTSRELLNAAGAALDGEGAMGSQTVAALVARVEESVRSSLAEIPSKVGSWATSGAGGFDFALTWLLNLFLVPVYAFFLVLAMPSIRVGVRSYLPVAHKASIIRIIRDIEKVVAAFFRGRLLICVLCAITACSGFLVIGWFGITVPYGVLFGLAIGLATAIPLAGLVFLIPALALAMLEPGAGAMHAGAVIGVYLLVQGLEAVLIPAIMGREVELHPVTLIVALLLCGKLLGVIGLVLAVPIAASVRILLREWFWPRLASWSKGGPFALPTAESVDDSGPRPVT